MLRDTRLGTSDRKRLRRKFANHDVQERDERECKGERDAVNDFRVGDVGKCQHRLDQAGEGGFADPAKTEGSKRDAELASGEIGIQVGAYCSQHAPAQAMGLGELLGLGAPELDDRELGRDEEPVEQDE